MGFGMWGVKFNNSSYHVVDLRGTLKGLLKYGGGQPADPNISDEYRFAVLSENLADGSIIATSNAV